MYVTVADEPLQVWMGDLVWRQILCTYKFCAGLTCVKTSKKTPWHLEKILRLSLATFI